MKEDFSGYFKPLEEKVEEIWHNTLFTFDANVLLNLYRYSDETRKEVFQVLGLITRNSWFSNQSILEYLENRLKVIYEQEKSYKTISEELKKIELKFDHARQHPFLSKRLLKLLKKAHEDVGKELEKSQKKYSKRLVKDEIQEKLANLTKGKIGTEFDFEAMKTICNEGKIRYSKRIPPGYKDNNKDDIKEQRAYGDYILWRQIIDKALETKKNIIFITDDQKEDWWRFFNGKTIGPRPELIKEFRLKTNQEILIYRPDQFLKLVGKYLKSQVGEEAIKEVSELASKNKSEIVTLKPYSDDQYLDTNEIIYLKAENNSTNFVKSDGTVVTAYKTLDTFEKRLPDNFIRVHKSYILNVNYVIRINYGKKTLEMRTSSVHQVELPFSNFYKHKIDDLRKNLD